MVDDTDLNCDVGFTYIIESGNLLFLRVSIVFWGDWRSRR